MTTISINEMHNRAMDLAEKAQTAKIRGDIRNSLKYFTQSFELEQAAATQAAKEDAPEPTRSVLLRSAASLALDCKKTREAEKLVALALSGSPPYEIAEELRDLLEQVNFSRHLELRGITLESNEVQLSIAGSSVGPGYAFSNEIIGRVQTFDKLVIRTVERKLNHPYRDQGTVSQTIREGYNVLMSVPRAASFAISLKIGQTASQPMLGCDAEGIIDDITENLELLNDQKEDKLRENIPDDAYLVNFIALARKLAPSGKDVNLVGLTYKSRRVQLTRLRSQFEITGTKKTNSANDKIIVTGKLDYADEKHELIKLTEDKSRTTHSISVPEGMMADIVRPLWGLTVKVTGTQEGKAIRLEQIEESKPEEK